MLITLLNELFEAIEANKPAKARMSCNRVLAFLAPLNIPYGARFTSKILYVQNTIKERWHVSPVKYFLLKDVDALIRECEAQNRINRAA